MLKLHKMLKVSNSKYFSKNVPFGALCINEIKSLYESSLDHVAAKKAGNCWLFLLNAEGGHSIS